MSQASLLDLIGNDDTPLAKRDRELIEAAILADGRNHGGLVDQNRVRDALSNDHGLTVRGCLLGPTYRRMRLAGLIERTDMRVPNTDKRGRNLGKDCPVYRLVGA